MDQFQEAFFKKHGFHKINILLLQKGEIVEIPLTGHCMKPLLQENDLITIKPIPVYQLRCGDVVLYHIEGRLKCHRFLRFKTIQEQQYLITKSDRRLGYDPPVLPDNYLGKVIKLQRGHNSINFNTLFISILNIILGKLSPYLSKIEYRSKSIYWFLRKCASRAFRMVMGVGYQEYIKRKRRN
jgi:signal peptidase I